MKVRHIKKRSSLLRHLASLETTLCVLTGLRRRGARGKVSLADLFSLALSDGSLRPGFMRRFLCDTPRSPEEVRLGEEATRLWKVAANAQRRGDLVRMKQAEALLFVTCKKHKELQYARLYVHHNSQPTRKKS